MGNRYFLAEPPGSNRAENQLSSTSPEDRPLVTLHGEEAHHLIRVLRAAAGQEVTLFDGSGTEYQAVVIRTGRREATLRIEAQRQVDRESPLRLHLAVALPKGDRQRWLVEKLVEVGATSLIPLITRRGVAQPTAKAGERLQRYVVEASKQCGRNRLMQVEPPCDFTRFVASPPSKAKCLLAQPASQDGQPSRALGEVKDELLRPGSENLQLCIAIGPEGGFTEEEISAAEDAGWERIDLGPRILRVETAAVAVAARLVLA